MKKKLLALAVVMVLPFVVGFNKQLIDLEYTFERAIIKLPNGQVLEDEVLSWRDYERGDSQIQVKLKSGLMYLVDSKNIVLIHDEKSYVPMRDVVMYGLKNENTVIMCSRDKAELDAKCAELNKEAGDYVHKVVQCSVSYRDE